MLWSTQRYPCNMEAKTEHIPKANNPAAKTNATARQSATHSLSNTWIFNLESTASLLIALGGFLSALVGLGCIPDTPIYRWAEACFFVFQLPVFYFGYGYLYQQQWTVRNPSQWGRSVRREIILMMVPLVSITFFTLLVNSWVGKPPEFSLGNLVYCIFVDPVIPVGFFLVALVMYIVTPTIDSPRDAIILLTLAAIIKIAAVVLLSYPATSEAFEHLPYVVVNFCGAWIWFVAGMALSWIATNSANVASGVKQADSDGISGLILRFTGLSLLTDADNMKRARAVCTVIWLAISILMFMTNVAQPITSAVMTAIGLVWFTTLFANRFARRPQMRFYGFIDSYTKGIWLMHPMFMKAYFFILASAGVTATGTMAAMFVPAHIIGGLAVVYLLPIVVLWAMNHIWKLGFLVNPANYLPKVHS